MEEHIKTLTRVFINGVVEKTPLEYKHELTDFIAEVVKGPTLKKGTEAYYESRNKIPDYVVTFFDIVDEWDQGRIKEFLETEKIRRPRCLK